MILILNSTLFSFLTAMFISFIGEGLIQGGWIIFDANGEPKAAFKEDANERIPINDILACVMEM